MYKYLFGPVVSRRLGISLGVDLVQKKVCTLDCVYCEVGKTTKSTVDRMEYIPFEKIINELKDYFVNNPDPDYITFSGAGEPTLNSRIGDVIKFIKTEKPNISVAVITNGTLLNRAEVRNELMSADLVLPSLDAVTESTLKKIDRPDPQINVKEYIDGLIKFADNFSGEIWLEIFILPDYNDSKKDLLKLKEVIAEIAPQRVQLNTLDRPGTEDNIRASTPEELRNIINLWKLDNVEIVSKAAKKDKKIKYRNDIKNTILGTISRRPSTIDDISEVSGIKEKELKKILAELITTGVIKTIEKDRGIFYQINEKY